MVAHAHAHGHPQLARLIKAMELWRMDAKAIGAASRSSR